MNQDFATVQTTFFHELATYASCVIPQKLARPIFEEALDMFLKAYRLQAEERVANQEEDVAHMETCQCFVDDDVLLMSVSMMFQKIIQNQHFLGFWNDSAIVDTMQKKLMYIHMTFVILCDITVRFWDDHVDEMKLYKSYIAPSRNADQERKHAIRAFNKHYFNVFSWIDCNADIFKYDLTGYNRPKKRMR